MARFYAFLRERHALTGVVAGLAVVVHAPTSSYVGLAIGLAYLIRVRHYGIRTSSMAGLLMLLCSAPDRRRGHRSARRAAARLGAATCPHRAGNRHLGGGQLEPSGVLLYNLLGGLLLAVALLLGAARVDPSSGAGAVRRRGVLCAVAFVFIDVSLRGAISTLVARLQLPRAAWVVDVLGLVYVAHLLRTAWAEHRVPRPILVILFGAHAGLAERLRAARADLGLRDAVFVAGAGRASLAARLAGSAMPT